LSRAHMVAFQRNDSACQRTVWPCSSARPKASTSSVRTHCMARQISADVPPAKVLQARFSSQPCLITLLVYGDAPPVSQSELNTSRSRREVEAIIRNLVYARYAWQGSIVGRKCLLPASEHCGMATPELHHPRHCCHQSQISRFIGASEPVSFVTSVTESVRKTQVSELSQ